MKISNPFKAFAEKYRTTLKNNQPLAHRIGTGMMFAGFLGMLALGVVTTPATAPLLLWGGIAASAATLVGGMQVKYTLSLFFIADEEAKRKSSPAARMFEPVAQSLTAKKEPAASFVHAARRRFAGKPPAASNNNEAATDKPRKKAAGPKG